MTKSKLTSKPRLNANGVPYHGGPAVRRTRDEQANWKIDAGLGGYTKNTPNRNTRYPKSRKPSRSRIDHKIVSSAPHNEIKHTPVLSFHSVKIGKRHNTRFIHKSHNFSIQVDLLEGYGWIAVCIGKNPYPDMVGQGDNPQTAIAQLLGLKKWYFDGYIWTSAYDEHRKPHIILKWIKDGKIVEHKRTLPKKRICPTLRKRVGKRMFYEMKTVIKETPKPTHFELPNQEVEHKRTTNELLGAYSADIGRL